MKPEWKNPYLPGAATLRPVIDDARLTLAVGETTRGTTTVRFESNVAYHALGNARERRAVAEFARELLRLCASQEVAKRDPEEVFG
jgi:hypothetical protein